MKRCVELFIKNEQYYGYDNTEIIEFEGKGTVYKKRTKYYIVYNDPNYNGARTSIKIEPEKERIFIHRVKPELKQVFEYGSKTKGSFITPYGAFNLDIYTSLLDIDIESKIGSIKINYKLYLNGHYTSQNYLSISWDIL